MLLDCLKFRKNKGSINIQGTKTHKGRTKAYGKGNSMSKKVKIYKNRGS